MSRARDNPFRAERLHGIRYRAPNVSSEALFERFEVLGRRAALVGDHGTGKTTLLADFTRHLSAVGEKFAAIRLSTATRKSAWSQVRTMLEQADRETTLILDGAEQLAWLPWLRFRRVSIKCRGLLITTHRPGRLPTLFRTSSSPDLLIELIAELTADSAAPSPSEIHDLHRRHRGNIRNCLRELYDAYPL